MAGLADKLLAVVAMLTALRTLLAGATTTAGKLSWRRGLVLAAGGVAAVFVLVGLLALQTHLFERPMWWPTWLGGTLAFFGGMLGVSTILAGRPPEGLTEAEALRTATQAVAMTVFAALPVATLAILGLTRVLRATLPWTVSRLRWAGAAEGVVLLALCLLERTDAQQTLLFSLELGHAGG